MQQTVENITASVLLAGTFTIIAILVLRPLAKAIGLIDSPGGRKKHNGQIPLIGGIAIFLGSAAGLTYLQDMFIGINAFVCSVTLLFAIGLVDDFYDIPPLTKLGAQITAALIMVLWGNIKIEGLANLFIFGPLNLDTMSIPITVIAVVGYINATNMSDGIDGLAGSLTLIPLLALAIAAYNTGLFAEYACLMTISVTIFVFLAFNARHPLRSRAGIFLGDAGSMLLGFTVAWFVVYLAKSQPRAIDASTALWIVGVPFIDLVAVTLQRIIKRRSPFKPDRAHFHHLLLLAGFSVNQTVLIISGLAVIFASTGLVGQYFSIPGPIMFYLFFAFFIFSMILLNFAWRTTKIMAKFRRSLRQSLRSRVQNKPAIN
ncbi:MAG: undecaprenyl/decaprenyl-phosphate alpha-N-acetylglucosaminyl 1-phosphate transferase [Gammaproteobacteria bacterium]|nr:undecaprenyl/decaprenyl-phosphate alpha-N-acetylglucosaminyl 1-phosphate transferase [Gammaproteobacteria bacterium]